MDFSFQAYGKESFLNIDDLHFFYYDICKINHEWFPIEKAWDTVVKEYKSRVDIVIYKGNKLQRNTKENTISFTVSSFKNSDNGSSSSAFFRHLRNAFSHYLIVRMGDDYLLTDESESGNITMCGRINADLLKEFCFRLFELRDEIIEKTTAKEDIK